MPSELKLHAKIIDALMDRKLILFIGAGLGRDCGMPAGAQLAQTLAKDLEQRLAGSHEESRLPEVRGNSNNLIAVASVYEQTLGQQKAKDRVCELIRSAQKTANRSSADLLAELPPMDVFTTNYDTLLESSHSGDEYVMIYKAEDVARQRPGRWNIVKLHGHVEDPQSIVLTQDDYDIFVEKHKGLIDMFRQGLRGAGTCVVIGASLTDPDVRTIVKEVSNNLNETALYVLTLDDADSRVAEWQPYNAKFLKGTIQEFARALKQQYETRVGNSPGFPKVHGAGEAGDCNPFRFFRTDEILTDELDIISRYFAYPSDFADVVAPGNTIIEGHRGSGKSWILRYMSLEVQRRLGTRGQYVGFYVKCKPSAFDCTRRRDESDDEWRDFFTHYMNTVIISRIIDSLEVECRAGHVVIADGEAECLCDYVARYVFRKPSMVRSDGSAAQRLRRLYNELELLGDDCRKSRRKLDSSDYSTSQAVARFIRELRDVLPKLFPPTTRVFVLLDEFDNLDQDQQAVILTQIRDRMADYSYKIAVKAGAMTLFDINKRPLELTDDYAYVTTDRFSIENEDRYIQFLRDIADTRLRTDRFDIGIDDLLPKRPSAAPEEMVRDLVKWTGKDFSGFRNYALLASGIARDFVSLLKDTLYYSNPKIAEGERNLTPVPWKIQNEIIRMKSAIHNRDYGAERHPEEVHKLLEAIGSLFRRTLEITLARFAEESDKQLYDAAKRWDRVRQVSRFHIKDLLAVDPEIRQYLDEAVDAQLLQIPMKPREPQQRGDSLRDHFVFHRLLCPYFKLSVSDRHPRAISAEQLRLAIDAPDRFVASLAPKLRGDGAEDDADVSESKPLV